MLTGYVDAHNVPEAGAAPGNAPGGDNEKWFEAVKAKTLLTNNGDKSPPKGAKVMLGGSGPTFPPISPIYIPQVSIPSISPEDKTKLADPNVEPQFNLPGATGSMGTPSNFSLFPNGSPSVQDVDQHGISDCSLDAQLGSLAAQDPDFIKNMVHDNGDGTYTVHLYAPNGASVDVTVNNQVPLDSDGHLASVGGPNDQANWATIIEKAYAKYNDVFHVTGKPGDSGYAAVQGAGIEAYKAFTGQRSLILASSFYGSPEEQTALAKLMQEDIKSGQIVFAGVVLSQNPTLPGGGTLPTVHGYSVVDVNQDASGNWYVDLRNPWGFTPGVSNPGGTDDGIIRMPMSDYVTYVGWTEVGGQASTTALGKNSLTSDPNKVPFDADMSPISVKDDNFSKHGVHYDVNTAAVTIDGYAIRYSQNYSLTIADQSGKDITPSGMADGSDGSFTLPDGAEVKVSHSGEDMVFSVTHLGVTEQVTFKGAGGKDGYDVTRYATTPATS
jgi:hypothetical protein